MADFTDAPEILPSQLTDTALVGELAGTPTSLVRVPGDVILSLVTAAATGFLRFATAALRDADTTSPDGTLAYVYDNNGDPADAGNGWFQIESGSWVRADWISNDLIAAVQSLVDEAGDSATEAETAAGTATAASAAFEASLKAIQHMGTHSPVTGGSAISNATISFGYARQDFNMVRVHGYWAGSGTIKVKVWAADGSSQIREVSQAVTSGDNSYDVAISGRAGQLVLIYGNSLFARTASAAPMTPYMTFTGDVTSGTLPNATPNYRVELSITLFATVAVDELRTRAARAGWRRVIRHSGLTAKTLASTLGDDAVAWAGAEYLPEGWLQQLKVKLDRAGAGRVYFMADGDANPYDSLPFYSASTGVLTLTTSEDAAWGTRIPTNFYIRPNTRAFWHCSTYGAGVNFSSSTAANTFAGAISYTGRYSLSPPRPTNSVIAYSSSARFINAEWTVDQPFDADPSDIFYDVTFTGTAIDRRFRLNAGTWTFDSSGAHSVSTGRANSIEAWLHYCLDRSTRIAQLELDSASTIGIVAVAPESGSYGTAVQLDRTTGNVSFGNMQGSNTAPDYTDGSVQAFPGGLGTGPYEVRFHRLERVITITVTDTTDRTKFLVHVEDCSAGVAPSLPSPADTQGFGNVGMMSGGLRFWADAGTITVKRAIDLSPDRRATALLVGDSIANGARIAYSDTHCVAIRNARSSPTAIMAVDIWTGGNMQKHIAMLVPHMPNLQYLLVSGGTNNTATEAEDEARFDASAEATKMLADSYGVTMAWGIPPNYPGVVSLATKTDYIEACQALGIRMVRFDWACGTRTDEADPFTADPDDPDLTLFYADSGDPHSLATGQARMFDPWIAIGFPELLG